MKDHDNLTTERPTFVTHLECAMEGDHYPADQIHNLSKANKPLLVRYDLAGVKKSLSKEALKLRPADLWRYREMLPVRKVGDIVSLGEVTTPLIRLPMSAPAPVPSSALRIVALPRSWSPVAGVATSSISVP